MTQMARNAVDEIDGVFRPIRFALHDRDSKFCNAFRTTLRSGAFGRSCALSWYSDKAHYPASRVIQS
jgi:hypothetical protein